MDDGSTDGSAELLQEFADGWDQVRLIPPMREKGSSYVRSPGEQYNYLVEHCRGEKLLIQCAEIIHCDDILTALDPYCHNNSISIATVLNCDMRKFTIDPTDEELKRKLVDVEPWQVKASKITLESDRMVIQCPCSTGTTSQWRTVEHNGISYAVADYSGYRRPFPFLFCGMITREDWDGYGGYADHYPADTILGRQICAGNGQISFCKCLAIHIKHK